MKKLSIIIISILIIGVGTYIYLDQQTETIDVDADFYRYSNLDELREASDLIVIASPETRNNYLVTDELGIIEEGYTISEIKVNEVIKSNKDKVAKNNTISVIEPYHYYDLGIKPGQILLSIEGYVPMKDNLNYILFLTLNEAGDKYLINGLYQGKHNVDNKDEEEKEFMEYENKLKVLNAEIKDRFKDEISNWR